jgi:hypothetical protein
MWLDLSDLQRPVPDAPLTKLGREQSVQLNKDTQELQRTAELLVSSALRRPLSTMILGYPESVSLSSCLYAIISLSSYHTGSVRDLKLKANP